MQAKKTLGKACCQPWTLIALHSHRNGVLPRIVRCRVNKDLHLSGAVVEHSDVGDEGCCKEAVADERL